MALILSYFKLASTNSFPDSLNDNSKIKNSCSLELINPKQTYIVFMGVFHCAWMNDIGSDKSKDLYYLTKGYKGILKVHLNFWNYKNSQFKKI